jgi:hypothetical protein
MTKGLRFVLLIAAVGLAAAAALYLRSGGKWPAVPGLGKPAEPAEALKPTKPPPTKPSGGNDPDAPDPTKPPGGDHEAPKPAADSWWEHLGRRPNDARTKDVGGRCAFPEGKTAAECKEACKELQDGTAPFFPGAAASRPTAWGYVEFKPEALEGKAGDHACACCRVPASASLADAVQRVESWCLGGSQQFQPDGQGGTPWPDGSVTYTNYDDALRGLGVEAPSETHCP